MEPGEMTVVETEEVKGIKNCIVGIPDVGLVGVIAAAHLIGTLKAVEAGHIESDLLPPVIVIHDGKPKAPIRLYTKGSLAIVTSEVPIQSTALPPLARALVQWAKSKGVENLISLSGIAVQNRLDIETPEVFGVASSEEARKTLKAAGIQMLEEGFMVGPHALILKECLRNEVSNAVLLAQAHYQYPDPGAAAAALSALSKLLGVKIDVESLLEQAEEIRLKTRELMQRTQRSMQRMEKAQEQELPPMYA
jgi:uncharacterized protein